MAFNRIDYILKGFQKPLQQLEDLKKTYTKRISTTQKKVEKFNTQLTTTQSQLEEATIVAENIGDLIKNLRVRKSDFPLPIDVTTPFSAHTNEGTTSE